MKAWCRCKYLLNADYLTVEVLLHLTIQVYIILSSFIVLAQNVKSWGDFSTLKIWTDTMQSERRTLGSPNFQFWQVSLRLLKTENCCSQNWLFLCIFYCCKKTFWCSISWQSTHDYISVLLVSSLIYIWWFVDLFQRPVVHHLSVFPTSLQIINGKKSCPRSWKKTTCRTYRGSWRSTTRKRTWFSLPKILYSTPWTAPHLIRWLFHCFD